MPSTETRLRFSWPGTYPYSVLQSGEGYRFAGWQREWLRSALVMVSDSVALTQQLDHYVWRGHVVAVDRAASGVIDVDKTFLQEFVPDEKIEALFRGDRDAFTT